MKKIKVIKLIIINFFVLFSLLGFLFLLPPISYYLYSKANSFFYTDNDILNTQGVAKDLSYLPNYKNYPWAKEYFEEASSLMTSYNDYLIWRLDDFKGKHINITNGIRQTKKPKEVNNDNVFWFFGGSAMWGTGSDDNRTIPSLFAQKTNFISKNYGNTNYVARQSYELLFNEYMKLNQEDQKKHTIVFYDGVNDIENFCNKKFDGSNSYTKLESYIRDEVNIKTKPEEKYSFNQTFFQLRNFTDSIVNKYRGIKYKILKPDSSNYYDCDTNLQKADLVARNLIYVWEQGSLLAKSKGDQFVAILQPVIFIGNSKKDHLNLQNVFLAELKKQFLVVYPLIIKYALEKNINFLDFSDIYNEDDYIYIDFCHLSPNGNEIVVNKIISEFKDI